jgi:hypothetical protein
MLLAMFVIGIRRGAKAIMSTAVRSEDKVALALPLTLLTAVILSGLFEDNLIGRGTIINVTFCATLGIFAVYKSSRTEHESKAVAAEHSFA